jgi:type II secretory pathway pseudopilin PulG
MLEILIVIVLGTLIVIIGVPNIIDAQMRAKVSRVKDDMRRIAPALEAYLADHGRYPLVSGQPSLTSPVAYISRWPNSPFQEYVNPLVHRWELMSENYPTYMLFTQGPTVNEDFWDPRFNPSFSNLAEPSVCDNCQARNYILYATWGISPRNVVPPPTELMLAHRDKSWWSIRSTGPDGQDSLTKTYQEPATHEVAVYDPTNGTVSWGDIILFGPEVGFP